MAERPEPSFHLIKSRSKSCSDPSALSIFVRKGRDKLTRNSGPYLFFIVVWILPLPKLSAFPCDKEELWPAGSSAPFLHLGRCSPQPSSEKSQDLLLHLQTSVQKATADPTLSSQLLFTTPPEHWREHNKYLMVSKRQALYLQSISKPDQI